MRKITLDDYLCANTNLDLMILGTVFTNASKYKRIAQEISKDQKIYLSPKEMIQVIRRLGYIKPINERFFRNSLTDMADVGLLTKINGSEISSGENSVSKRVNYYSSNLDNVLTSIAKNTFELVDCAGINYKDVVGESFTDLNLKHNNSNRFRILAGINLGYTSPVELKEFCDISLKAVYDNVDKLANEGFIFKNSRNREDTSNEYTIICDDMTDAKLFFKKQSVGNIDLNVVHKKYEKRLKKLSKKYGEDSFTLSDASILLKEKRQKVYSFLESLTSKGYIEKKTKGQNPFKITSSGNFFYNSVVKQLHNYFDIKIEPYRPF